MDQNACIAGERCWIARYVDDTSRRLGGKCFKQLYCSIARWVDEHPVKTAECGEMFSADLEEVRLPKFGNGRETIKLRIRSGAFYQRGTPFDAQHLCSGPGDR